MAEGTEPAAEAESAPKELAEAEAETETDDVFAGDDPKAKFREALARKHGGGGKSGAGADGSSKISATHGPAKSQRTFRRKSGG